MVETAGHNSRLETIGSAAAGIAHDINNQLTLILNYLEITDLRGAREAADRCCALTSSLLSYCRNWKTPFRTSKPTPLPSAACSRT